MIKSVVFMCFSGGFGFTEEMCVNYVHYYPKVQLEVNYFHYYPKTQLEVNYVHYYILKLN